MAASSISPLSVKLKPVRLVGFDTEDDSKGTPLSFAFHDGKNSFYTHLADEAIDYIYNTEEETCFVAHNLEYDIVNLFKNCDYKYINEMVYASKLLKVTLYGTKCWFLNSYSFFQGSLKKMAPLVGMKKLDGDVFNPDYNIRDAHIVQVFMVKLQKRFAEIGVNLGMTIGQLSMATYRRKYVKTPILTYNHPDVLNSYYGGRVEMFYRGLVKGPLHVIDIKSSYPDVMKRHSYPDTAYMEPSTLESHEFGSGKFTMFVPADIYVPPLPYRSPEGRLFFPTGKFTGSWTYAEIRYAVTLGCEVLKEFPGAIGTNRALRPFTGFIDEFWDLREHAEKRRDSGDNVNEMEFELLFLKLVMNNLYGKFAQWKPSTKLTRYPLSESELDKLQGVRFRKVGCFYGYTIPREKPPKSANYPWGVHITAYARISLHEKIMGVHNAGGTLVYCDTDSIMFTGNGLNTVTIGKKLGQMSLETFDLGVFRQAKGYLLCKETEPGKYLVSKVACKGVPTHLGLDFIKEGVARFVKPQRLKEGEIRVHAEVNKKKSPDFIKSIGANVWKDVEKFMKGIYVKRKGLKGKTYPLDVEEIAGAEALQFTGEDDVSAYGFDDYEIVGAPKPNDPFRNIVAPPGWFDGESKFTEEEKFFRSQGTFFLTTRQLAGLKTGAIWFSGLVHLVKTNKHGKFYSIYLKSFLGEKVAKKKMLAAISEKFMRGGEEKYLGKHVAIILRDEYIKGSSLEYDITIK